ncbi:LysR family transcriptional regulator [Neisseria sp. Ec49-e6-T10]|uniref:LysR family transcriptional regulator n=1 Tax=Neisseria sp. Ec49-e6-T10 TaxID=3140744 RepID=UPI003EBA3657
MNKLEDLQIFVTVMQTLSFTEAADKLGLSKQFVSRRIMQLEENLGVRLLLRTTRRLNPTNLGYHYYDQIEPVLTKMAEIEQSIGTQNIEPKGVLRLTVPVSFTTIELGQKIAEFLALYPKVSIEMDLSDRFVDLVAEGYDMAIRIGFLQDSSMIARKLTPINLITCCSPEYIKQNGIPLTPYELKNHECLLYGHSKNVEWPFTIDGKLKNIPVFGRYRTNNGELLTAAAIKGLGITSPPEFLLKEAIKSKKLVTILEEYNPKPSAAYAVYPYHKQSSLLINTLVEFLIESFKTDSMAT